jgi:hypothetical protein
MGLRVYVAGLLMAIFAFEGLNATPEFKCEEVRIAIPKSLDCGTHKNLTYCEYRKVNCVGIPATDGDLYWGAQLGYPAEAWIGGGQLDGICPPVENKCPHATECLNPANKVPEALRKAILAVTDPNGDFSSLEKSGAAK